LDDETGLYYYGARYYNPQVSVWLSVDAMADKYPSLSPYAFVANNSIMLVDPDGNQIDPASQADWDKNKQNIQNKVTAYEYLHTTFGVPAFQEKANTLKGTLSGMAKMEDTNNPTVYKLGQASAGVGFTYMNSSGEIVMETNGSTEHFVHEVTHGIQFENKEVAYEPGTKNAISSYANEIEAYTAELAYAGSLGAINPNVGVVTNKSQITRSFINGIVDNSGKPVYGNLSLFPLNPNMNYKEINRAYMHLKVNLQPGDTFQSIFPNYKWKK
jgi:RHS repeat-associated protein